LNWLGQFEAFNGNLKRACPALEESIAHARALGDRRVLSMALRHLGLAVLPIGDHARSRKHIEEALAVSREMGSKREIAWNLCVLAQSLAAAGQREAVEPLLLESLAIGRESGDSTPVLTSMWLLGRLYALEGEFERARRQVDGALGLARQVDYKVDIPSLLITLGDLAASEQDWKKADDLYREGLSGANLMGPRGVAHALRDYAAICGARGDHRRAVRIFGATSSVLDSADKMLPGLQTGEEADVVGAAQRALGTGEFSTAWTESQSITIEQVIAEILSQEREEG
jgi:tetratricopeptide (TPR) repeat protein